MNDKCIIVTGSSSGIGRSITSKLLGLGAKVIGLARDHNKFKINNKNYVTYKIDLNDFHSLAAVTKNILKENPQINALVSNAGYGDFGPLENFSIDQIEKFISMNLTSHIVLTKCLLPHFKEIGGGDIIYMGSEAGLSGAKNGSLYCSAKFGLRGLSQSISRDVSNKNIRVCIINPGMVRTSFFKDLKFSPGDDSNNAIDVENISSSVINILKLERNTVIDEINLSPLKKVLKFK